MKTKRICLTAVFSLYFLIPGQSQTLSDQNPLAGFQSSINAYTAGISETFESLIPIYEEAVRLGMILNNDIRMKMNADFSSFATQDANWGQAWIYETNVESSLYAEFDWQNMAERMRLKSKGSGEVGETIVSQDFNPFMGPGFERPSQEQDITMYIDAQGYWYVPVDNPDIRRGYVRVNPSQGLQNIAESLEIGIEAAIDARINIIEAEWANAAPIYELGTQEMRDEFEALSSMTKFVDYFDPGQLHQLVSDLVGLQSQQLGFFPAFIHFAFFISPHLARSEFNVREEILSWRGQDDCIRMTILSGDEAGYMIVFDRYGRLIHLRDKEGETADYWYDRDVTVNIPPAVAIPGF